MTYCIRVRWLLLPRERTVEREAHSTALLAPCTLPVELHSPGSHLSLVKVLGMGYRDIVYYYSGSGEEFYPFS